MLNRKRITFTINPGYRELSAASLAGAVAALDVPNMVGINPDQEVHVSIEVWQRNTVEAEEIPIEARQPITAEDPGAADSAERDAHA